MLTLSRAAIENPSALLRRSTSASIAVSAGSWIFRKLATWASAPSKQADQPAANNCSGLVPLPGRAGAVQLDAQAPVVALRLPFAAADGVSAGSVENLFPD